MTALLDTYRATSPADRYRGRQWYPRALAECRAMACYYGIPVRRVAGIVAALSPRMHWGANLAAADALIATGSAPALGRNVAKGRRILAGERPLDVLSGPKVRAFYRCILGATDCVCVDVWAARAAGHEGAITATDFDRIADGYREAAAIVGEAPRDLQAILWTAVRGVKPSDGSVHV